MASAQTRTLRIATYNIEDDIDGATVPLPGLIAPATNTNDVQAGGVLEGIGEEIIGNDSAQPLDILALEETTSNPTTITPIVNGLNAFYSYYNVRALYTNSTYQATESGGDVADGNGPNAIVYNTQTLQLLASVPVDPSGGSSQLGSSSGELREVMRYEFAPAGISATATNEFYIYVSHYKSGGSSYANERNGEAKIVRNNMTNLPSTARIIYVGDFNTGDTSEPMFATLTSVGVNQMLDPLNSAGSTTIDFDGSSGSPYMFAQTESSTYLEYRDDYQMMTTNIFYASGNGLKLIPGTYHAFGNNGTTAYKGTVNSGANTSLTNLIAGAPINASQLLLDLTHASDHLPVVADYTIPIPAPVFTSVNLAGTNLVFTAGNAATNGTYIVLTTTNLLAPLTSWTPLATNISGGSAFNFTLTNAVSPATTRQFYTLLQQ